MSMPISKRSQSPSILGSIDTARQLRRSGLFHNAYYKSQHAGVPFLQKYLLRYFPAWHYTLYGRQQQRNPNPLFDTAFYLDNNRDVVTSGMNPLLHYIRFGADERRNPSPYFDTGYYVDNNPDVVESGINPLLHYLRQGAKEGRGPNRLFENLAVVAKPGPCDFAAGHDWLRQALGPGGKRAPRATEGADGVIRFDWDRGAWNNIRMQVEILVCLAERFNRAIVLPEPDKWLHIAADSAHLFEYYDEDTFRAAVRVVPSTTRAEDEWKVPWQLKTTRTVKLGTEHFESQRHRATWYFPRDTRMFGYFPIVMGSDPELYALVHRAFRLRAEFLDMAVRQLQDHQLLPGGYLAVHVRRGDLQYQRVRHVAAEAIVEALRAHGADEVDRLLVVSDEYDEQLLELCRHQGWHPVCWATQHTIDPKFSGILDMLCCCLAWRFVGTPLSTFSTGIMHWRGYVSRVAGSRVDAVPRFTLELDFVPWWAWVDAHCWLAI
jgi:hypothetical protein